MNSPLKKLESTAYVLTTHFHLVRNLKIINIFSTHSRYRNATIITQTIIKTASGSEVEIKYE